MLIKISGYKIILVFALFVIVSCNSENKKTNTKPINEQSTTALEEKQLDFDKLLEAALDGNINAVKKFDGIESVVNNANMNGSTALMLAAYNGHTKIVKYLLAKGAKVNQQDANNRTALIYASSGPFAETVELLLKNGADVNMVDNVEQFSALMFAAAEGNVDVLKILLNYNANKNHKDKDGETAMDFAVANNKTEAIKLLR